MSVSSEAADRIVSNGYSSASDVSGTVCEVR